MKRRLYGAEAWGLQQKIGGRWIEFAGWAPDQLQYDFGCSTSAILVDIDDPGQAMPMTPDELLSQLEKAGYETRTVWHPPLYTVDDSRRLRGSIDGRHTKNLFLKDKKDNFFLVTVGEDRTIDLKQLHKVIGAASRLSFGKPEKLMEYLGVEPGAVTAFSVINDTGGRVTAILDQELMDHDEINAHPLTNEATTTLALNDLIAFMSAVNHPPDILPVSE